MMTNKSIGYKMETECNMEAEATMVEAECNVRIYIYSHVGRSIDMAMYGYDNYIYIYGNMHTAMYIGRARSRAR